MIKTRSRSHSHLRPSKPANPQVDFDYKELALSARIFLGKEKAEALLKTAFSNQKDFLVLISEMETAAKHYRSNPKEPLLWEPSEKSSGYENEDEQMLTRGGDSSSRKKTNWLSRRQNMASEFLQLVSLRTEKSYRLNLAYRIRSEAQRDAIFTNKSELVTDKSEVNGTKEVRLRLRLSLKDLPKVLKGEYNAPRDVALALAPYSNVPEKAHPIDIVWIDEIPHRPDNTRQFMGRQTGALFDPEKGREEIQKIGQEFKGAEFILFDPAKTKISLTRTNGDQVSLKVESLVEPKVDQETGRVHPVMPTALLKDEQGLREYLSEQYSISIEEFVDSIPKVTDSLEKDLERATQIWMNPDNPSEEKPTPEEISNFLREYTAVSLTLQSMPSPLSSVSLNRLPQWKEIAQGAPRDIIQSTKSAKETRKEILSHLQSEKGKDVTLDRVVLPLIERQIENTKSEIGSTSPASLGSPEWAQKLAEQLAESGTFQSSEKALEAISTAMGMSPDDLQKKRKLILENFYSTGKGQALDNLPKERPVFQGYVFGEAARNEFYELQSSYDKAVFDAKGGKPKTETGEFFPEPNLQEFIRKQGLVEFEIPTSPVCLHRLTRYPNGYRNNRMGDRDKKAAYGSPKYLPRDRGQKSKVFEDLNPEDFLSEKGLKEIEELKADSSARSEKTLALYSQARATFNSWKRGFGLTLPAKPTSPIDLRLLQWANEIRREKRAGGAKETPRCDSLYEFIQLTDTIKRMAGLKVGGIDSPLQTQPLPNRSSTIAFQLLCGVPAQEITELKELHDIDKNPEGLIDFSTRWENALRADVFAPEPPTPEEALLERIKQGEEPSLLALEGLIQEKPNFLEQFYEKVGLPQAGPQALPQELKAYQGILPPFKASPLTFLHKGEECLLLTALQQIEATHKNNPEVLKILQESSGFEKVEEAVQNATKTWAGTINQVAEELEDISFDRKETIKGKRAKVSISTFEPVTAEQSSMSPGLAAALSFTQGEAEKSNTNKVEAVYNISRELFKPDVRAVEVHNGNDLVTLTKKAGEIVISGGGPSKEEDPAFHEILASIKDGYEGKFQNLPDEEKEIFERGHKQMEIETMLLKREALDLKNLPVGLEDAPQIKEEIKALKSTKEEIDLIEKFQKNLTFQVKNWGGFSESYQAKSVQQVREVFDFKLEIDSLIDRATPNNIQPSDRKKIEELKETLSIRFKDKLTDTFLHKSEEDTRKALQKEAQGFFQDQSMEASKNLPQHLEKTASTLREIAASVEPDGSVNPERNPELAKVLDPETGSFAQAIKTAELQKILLNKIQKAEKAIKSTSRERFANEPIQNREASLLGPDNERGAKNPTLIKLEGDQILTNKLWVKDVLSSTEGQEKLQSATKTFAWLQKKDRVATPEEKVAFLTYLHTNGVGDDAKNLLQEGKQSKLKPALEAFTLALRDLKAGKDGKENPRLLTTIGGGASLSLIDPEILLGKENLKVLEDAKENPPKKQEVPVPKVRLPESKEERYLLNTGIRTQTPFGYQDLEEATTRSRINEVKKAGEILRDME